VTRAGRSRAQCANDRACDPRLERRSVDRSSGRVGQDERSAGNAQIAQGRLFTAHVRHRDQLRRRVGQRRIELAIELPRDRGKHAYAEEGENGEERSHVPCCQSKAQARQRLRERRATRGSGHVPRR